MAAQLTVHLVTPVTGVPPPDPAVLAAGLGPDVTVTGSCLRDGPASIECELDEALAVPGTLAEVQAAAEAGAAAIVINCLGDPGLAAARELVSVPVLGPGQTSMHVAALLGHQFSILTVLDQLVHVDEAKAAHYGLAGRLASVRAVGIPVLELHDDPARLIGALTEQGVRAVRDDGAHVLILGCTGMQGLAERVTAALAARGVTGIPVIDPLAETLRIAAALARGGLSHSKRTYPDPPPKDRPALAAMPAAAAGRPG